MKITKQVLSFIGVLFVNINIHAADWPMWKHDARRSGTTNEELPQNLQLQWKRELGQPHPAWPPSQIKLQFDSSFEPIVAGKIIYVPSMNSDRVTAYNTDSGEELWRFYADGPVRFAPVIYKEKLYFTSDDGILYCLNAKSGKLISKTDLAPNKKKLLGNKRMISLWPARGGPVLLKNKIYVSAGIWPFMGTFIYSINADTSKVLWCNSGSGSIFIQQQHNSPAFAGIAPQGYITATENKLLISGGRTVPAAYDIKTGKFLYYHLSSRSAGKNAGGYNVSATNKYFYVGNSIYKLSDGKDIAQFSAALLADKLFYAIDKKGNLSANEYSMETFTLKNRKGEQIQHKRFKEVWKLKNSPPTQTIQKIILKAGTKLFCSDGNKTILSFDLKKRKNRQSIWKADWLQELDSKIKTAIAADKKLFAVTEKGTLYCFGKTATNKTYSISHTTLQRPKQKDGDIINKILKNIKEKNGYCLLYGLGTGEIIQELIQKTNMHVIVIDDNRKKICDFRRNMDDANLYGKRVTIFSAKIKELPPYFANLAIINTNIEQNKVFNSEIIRILRPYGGKALFLNDKNKTIIRKGPLPGAGSWTHQYGNAANSVVSKDKLVKLPLGVLWFGGLSNENILPRHGHGPAPQVINGRLFIEGRDILRAVDVYTGRLLWEKTIKNLGKFYDNTSHHPGANMIGSNYVSTEDAIYAITPKKCLMLSPETGETLKTFTLPNSQKWGFIATYGKYLVAAATPINISFNQQTERSIKKEIENNYSTLIEKHTTWKYLLETKPESNWKTVETLAKNWRSAPAGFGYGDNDDNTKLDLMKGKYLKLYIRKKFSFSDNILPKTIILKIRYDDAFIAYINGKEVLRKSISKKMNVAGHEAGQNFESFTIPIAGQLKQKNNILAIEGFNQGLASSDFTLDPFLLYENPTKKKVQPKLKFPDIPAITINANYASGSEKLFLLNRYSGKILWSRNAVYNFRHNAIIMANNTLFCIDRLSEKKLSFLKRHGYSNKTKPVLYAFDIKTGKIKWQTNKNLFGTWLGYSEKYNILLEAQSHARDRAPDEPTNSMAAFNADSGKLLWKNHAIYDGPCMLHKDKIITQTNAFNLLNGKKANMVNPFNKSKQIPWSFKRNYGCNTIIASENIMTFRSAAAGYFDLNTCSGVGNLGGFKSGCTSNLIAADGVLNAPDYTRTCTCSYQNQSSLAMIYMPDVEAWTYSTLNQVNDIQKVGLNFGAPGDMISNSGTLWLELPLAGSPSPNLHCTLDPPLPETFRQHSSLIHGKGLKWVAASGIKGIKSIKIDLIKNRKCNINLYFSEPEATQPGERIFSVKIEGKTALNHLDVFKESNGQNNILIKSFKNIKVDESLNISFQPHKGKTIIAGIEITN